MQSLGFSNLIIANSVFKPTLLKTTLDRMQDYGFKRFFFTLEHDVTMTTISRHLDDRKRLLPIIKDATPRGCYSDVLTNVAMNQNSVYEKQISRLGIKKTQYLPLQLPIFDGGVWLDASMRYLYFARERKPLFISFEKTIATYDPGYVRRAIKTRYAAFMIDINSFSNPSAIPYISQIIEKGAPILLGLSSPIEDYPALDVKMNYFKGVVGQDVYTKLILTSNRSTSTVFGLK